MSRTNRAVRVSFGVLLLLSSFFVAIAAGRAMTLALEWWTLELGLAVDRQPGLVNGQALTGLLVGFVTLLLWAGCGAQIITSGLQKKASNDG